MRRIFGLPKDDRPARARFLVDNGFDSVVVGAADTANSIRLALDAGLSVWSCCAAFSVRNLREEIAAPLLARDVDNAPQTWFGSGCPNQPTLRAAHLQHIRTVAESGAFAGFMLDGIRFASPNAGDAFFTCFCPTCAARASAHGIDFDAAQAAVRELRAWSRLAATPMEQSAATPLARSASELPAATKAAGADEMDYFVYRPETERYVARISAPRSRAARGPGSGSPPRS